MLALSFFLMMPAVLKAQNYVRAEDYLEKTTTVQYYDGIGRPTSLSQKGLNTSGKSVNTLTEYDETGREKRQWLPTPGSRSFNPMTASAISASSGTYFHDQYGYSDTEYDALGRALSVSTPGQVWNDTWAFCIQSLEKIILTVNTQCLCCEGKSHHLPIGEFGYDTVSRNNSLLIYLISCKFLADFKNFTELCDEVVHIYDNST